MKFNRWVLGVAVIAAALLLTYTIRNETPDPPTISGTDLPECGHSWKDLITVAQVKAIIDIPEFHDCQRFVVKDGAGFRYDSLFAIFASQTLASLEARLGPAQQVPPQATNAVGTLVTVPPDSPTFASFPPNLRAVTIAVVHADGPYDALDISKNLNCLYVWRIMNPGIPQQPETWYATMVRPAALACDDTTVGAIRGGVILKVRRVQEPGFTEGTDYPDVARWDWDDSNSLQYIGVKCGAAWCEIYRDNLVSSAPLEVPPGASVDVRRVRLIKGWYDQQYLATFGPDKKPIPSRIMGTIVPDPYLGDKVDANFEAGWVHVADIVLSAGGQGDKPALDMYKAKFNFVPGKPTDPMQLSIKGKKGDPLWEAKIRRSRRYWLPSKKYKNVMRRPVGAAFATTGKVVPGVARWRWMRTDEGTWTRCSAGCCEMSDY